jgi:hypothetical protein
VRSVHSTPCISQFLSVHREMAFSQRASDEGQGLGKVDGLVRVDLKSGQPQATVSIVSTASPGDVPTLRGRPI